MLTFTYGSRLNECVLIQALLIHVLYKVTLSYCGVTTHSFLPRHWKPVARMPPIVTIYAPFTPRSIKEYMHLFS